MEQDFLDRYYILTKGYDQCCNSEIVTTFFSFYSS